MNKDAVVLVVDVSASMGASLTSSGESGLDMAKRAISLMVQQKLIHPKQDEIGIVTVGSHETFNALADKDPGNYQHIRTLVPIKKPDISFLKTIDELDVEDGEGDVIDAVLVAMELLSTRVRNLKYNKRMFLITDAAGPISWAGDPDGLSSIVEGMIANRYKLNIIGVNFSDVQDDAEADDIPLVRHGSAVERRTERQQHNERLLRDVCDRVDGVVHTVDSAIELMRVFRKQVNQVTKYRGPLQIGTVSIDVYSYTMTQVQNLPTMKKILTEAERVGDGKEREEKGGGGGEGGGRGGGEDGEEDGDGGGDGLWGSGGGDSGSAVRIERQYWDERGDQRRLLAKEDRVKAYRYGKDLVPFDPDEEEALKYQADKCLQVLAFVDADKVGRWQFMSGVDCVCAVPVDDEHGRALSAFVLAMMETNKVALCRYVARKNARPMIVALIPEAKPAEGAECFYLVQLPFAEDVRDYNFANFDSNPVYVPNDSQRSIAKDLIRAMNLDNADTDEDGTPKPALEPDETYNPVIQYFYQVVRDRALDKSCPLPPLDPLLAKRIEPDPALLKAAEPLYRAFGDAFPLHVQDKEKRQTKRRFRMYDEQPTADDDLQQLSRRLNAAADGEAKEGEGGGGGMELGGLDDSLAFDRPVSQVDKVNSVDPVGSFKAMMRRKDDVTVPARAIREMQHMVDEVLDASYGDSLFERALQCVGALREGCVAQADADAFNGWLEGRREVWATRRKGWWERMKRDGVRPIDDSEVEDSGYSPQAADRFYDARDDISKSRSESLPVSASEDADLLEGMD